MQRVVVTGMGIVSCLGNDLASVSQSLARGRSGIRGVPSYVELGLRSQIAGTPQIEIEQHLDRRDLRFMGDAAAYAAIAMKRAIADSGLQEAQIN
ncbi:MAG TPA: beta-ketoacyl synthase N-terminal-like domain-containing protein, partial [Burkholderiales bacterium]|nr:beta-ketoacyl synthase N-terminal-like domain-containing protein [Burkholderiales bacterium]